MIEMTVRDRVGRDLKAVAVQEFNQAVRVGAGIDHQGLFPFTPDDVAVCLQGTGGDGFNVHGVWSVRHTRLKQRVNKRCGAGAGGDQQSDQQ